MGVAALIVKTKSPPEDADAAVAVDPVSDNGDVGMVYVFLLRNSIKSKNEPTISQQVGGGELGRGSGRRWQNATNGILRVERRWWHRWAENGW